MIAGYLSSRYGHMIQISGYLVFTGVNWPFHGRPNIDIKEGRYISRSTAISWSMAAIFRRRLRAYAPTSNTASHDNHEKINTWVSFFPIWEWGSDWKPFGLPELRYEICVFGCIWYLDGVELLNFGASLQALKSDIAYKTSRTNVTVVASNIRLAPLLLFLIGQFCLIRFRLKHIIVLHLQLFRRKIIFFSKSQPRDYSYDILKIARKLTSIFL